MVRRSRRGEKAGNQPQKQQQAALRVAQSALLANEP
jgi:hypothetical protein